MGKFEKKRKFSSGKFVLIIALILALAALVVLVMPNILYRLRAGDENMQVTEHLEVNEEESMPESVFETTEETKVQGIAFPVLLEDGRVEVDSLFPYSGFNPDAGNAEGTDIASIRLRNVSDTYISAATVRLQMHDGATLNFEVKDLPAGKSAMAFSTGNVSLSEGSVCIGAEGEASFDGSATLASDKVRFTVSGMTVNVTNVTGATLSEVVVSCHSPLNDEYFGGTSYSYTVSELSPGATATIDAFDCILGMAEVVRVTIK